MKGKMNRTIKIKLPFAPETAREKRCEDLIKWAILLSKENNPCVLEEKHYCNMSYIIVKNAG
ncbi:MAG: hypothetical protein CSA05_03210 [Bacteroidia bacterium]|nr:MAG: hypothetical protein CSA05_03210 [Bacteroidia bacterium]